MKKSLIAVSVAALFSSGGASAFTATVTTTGNNFTMLTAAGGLQGGTNDVTFTWDGAHKAAAAGVANATLSSPTPFAGNVWTAHHVEIFGPGAYTFYTGCASGGVASATYNPSCGSGTALTLTVAAGQVGAHMLFDWSSSSDIDVVVLWKMSDSWFNVAGTYTTGTNTVKNPFSLYVDPLYASPTSNTRNTVWDGVSIDAGLDGNTWNGTKMIDGPFIGSSANFNVMGVTTYTAPALSSTSPANAATSVSPGATSYSVTYNKAMLPASMTSGALTFSPAVTVGTPTSTDNITWSFPLTLAGSTSYTVTFNAGPTDGGGNAVTAPASRTFTTAAGADVTSPTIATKLPLSGATSVAANTTIAVTFDEAMGGTTAGAITVTKGGVAVPCTFVPDASNTVYTCTPASALDSGTVYTVSVAGSGTRTPSVAAAAQDGAGNNLITAGGNTWTFTTATVTTKTDPNATSAVITTNAGNVVSFSSVQGSGAPTSITPDTGLQYTINGVAGSVTVTLTFPNSIVGKTLYKVNAGTYTAIPESDFSRDPDGKTIVMTIADNGSYDTDATVGTITDPIVPASAVVASVLQGPGGSPGGGCTLNPSKPDYSLILALLASLGYLGWKRKKQ